LQPKQNYHTDYFRQGNLTTNIAALGLFQVTTKETQTIGRPLFWTVEQDAALGTVQSWPDF
jgi:hypothetical protein